MATGNILKWLKSKFILKTDDSTSNAIIQEWQNSSGGAVAQLTNTGALKLLGNSITTQTYNNHIGGVFKGSHEYIPFAAGGWKPIKLFNFQGRYIWLASDGTNEYLWIGGNANPATPTSNLTVRGTKGMLLHAPTGTSISHKMQLSGGRNPVEIIASIPDSSFRTNLAIKVVNRVNTQMEVMTFKNVIDTLVYTGINNANPTESVDATFTTKTEGRRHAITTKNSSYVCTKSDEYIKLNSNSESIVIELFDCREANHGQSFTFKVIDATNLITILAFSKTADTLLHITNPSGTTFRYEKHGGNISGLMIGSWVRIENSVNSGNNGKFQITNTDNSTYFEITNPNGVVEDYTIGLYRLSALDYDMSVGQITFICDSAIDTYEFFN